jgi:SAM-dependent methyltransferase
MPDVRDRWAAGADYEAFMGRWSRRLAPRFVAWLALPRGAHWLDVGCGTGALADAICGDAAPGSVVGCDPAAPLLAFAREHSRDARLTFVAAGVGALPRRPGGYGAAASLLALNFFPDAAAAVREMASLTAPGGCVAACVWDYAEGMELLARFWEAAVALDPAARDVDERSRFPLCRPGPLSALFRAAGLADVRCEALEIATPCADFDDLWRPLLGGTGPAPTYVATLDATRRRALARRLEETLPRAPDGAIALTARAWAVRGRVSA